MKSLHHIAAIYHGLALLDPYVGFIGLGVVWTGLFWWKLRWVRRPRRLERA